MSVRIHRLGDLPVAVATRREPSGDIVVGCKFPYRFNGNPARRSGVPVPSAACHHIPASPPRCEPKAIRLPFGVQAEYRSSAGSMVNRLNAFRPTSQIQISCS